MNPIFDKDFDEINLAMTNKMERKLINKFNNSVKNLKIIKKKIQIIENSLILKINKTKCMTRKKLE